MSPAAQRFATSFEPPAPGWRWLAGVLLGVSGWLAVWFTADYRTQLTAIAVKQDEMGKSMVELKMALVTLQATVVTRDSVEAMISINAQRERETVADRYATKEDLRNAILQQHPPR